MERRVARAEDLPPLELRRVRTLDLEEPSSPGGTRHVAAASGVVRRAEYVYVIADDELDLAVFDASSDAPGRLVPALSGELPSEHEARSKAKPDLEALTSLPPFEGHPHGALLGLGSGSTEERDRGFAWALGADGSLDGRACRARPGAAVSPAEGGPGRPERRGCRGHGRRAVAAAAREQRARGERRRRAVVRGGDRVARPRPDARSRGVQAGARVRPGRAARGGAHVQRRQRAGQRAARVHGVGRGLVRHARRTARSWGRSSARSVATARSSGCGRSTESTRSRACTECSTPA